MLAKFNHLAGQLPITVNQGSPFRRDQALSFVSLEHLLECLLIARLSPVSVLYLKPLTKLTKSLP